MEPTIRPMRVGDFAAVYELGLRCYKVSDKPYNYWSIREVADHLQGSPELCKVAEAGDKVVGFALGASTFEIIEDSAHLEWIAVSPEYRRKGLGGRLLESIVEVARELGRAQVVADIASDNAFSRGMARKAGFSEGLSVTYFVKELR